MKHSESFVTFWGINFVFFIIGPFILRNVIVVGNARLSTLLASIISGFLLATVNALLPKAFEYMKVSFKSEWQLALVLLVSNIGGLWLLARYADLTGIGLSNIWVVVFSACVITILQWLFEDQVMSKRKKSKSRR